MENPAYIYVMAQVGLCLNAWSQVETGMAQVFDSVSGINDFRKSGAIFDAILAFEGRVAVLDAAVQLETKHLSAEERELWACLSAKLRKLYKKRHEVAHFSIPNLGNLEANPGISPFFSYNKQGKGTAKFLTLKEMQERSFRFSAAAAAVTWFGNVLQRRVLPPKHHPPLIQEPDLILHIRESLAQKKEGQSPQPE